MIVAGIGFKKDANAESIMNAIDAALHRYKIARGDLDALATLNRKSTHAPLTETARHLNIPIISFALENLQEYASGAITRSPISERSIGLPSLSETSALAAIGQHAKLLGPRVSSMNATCALATSEPDKTPPTNRKRETTP